MKNGVQLYTFRAALAQDFRGTLREISKIGFDGVEFAEDYGRVPPEELAAYLKELHLACAGTMFSEKDLLSGDHQVYEYAHALNTPAVTVSIMTDFIQDYEEVLTRLQKLGAAARKNHCLFSYHNHWAEWVPMEGKSAMEQLLDHTDASAVFFEPDVCWITRGGADAPSLIRQYAARIRQIHFKDIRIADDVQTTVPLGAGIVNVAACLAAVREIGAPWGIVEQDHSADPFGDAAASLQKLRSL